MLAGKPAAALVEIVPEAPILPPEARAAEALRMRHGFAVDARHHRDVAQPHIGLRVDEAGA